ncbi:MAG: CHAT domain-containing protein [Nitrospira sp.]|nr:CHAT domain-containing protein [Nitrospira sp.]MDH5192942.1 CHAT domain-containing protein [Nitrospira sp.]
MRTFLSVMLPQLFLFLLIVLLAFTADAVSLSSADVSMQQGTQAFQRGAFTEALSQWKQAADLYKGTGNYSMQIEALTHSAHASMELGQSKQALQSLELALALANQNGQSSLEAAVLGQLGHTYLSLRQLTEASEYLQRATTLGRQQDSATLLAAALNDLGIVSALHQRDKEALEAFQESLELAQKAKLPLLAATARTNAARALLRLGQPTSSRLTLDGAFESLKNLSSSRQKSLGLIGIALGYQRLIPQLPQERDPLLLRTAGVLQEAVSDAERQGDKRTLSYALGYLGHLYETEFRMDEALQLTRRALFIAQSVDAPESLYRWQWQLGRQLAATGRLDQAIASYRQATMTLQPIRSEMTQASSDGPLSEQETVKPLFFELADLLLQRAALTDEVKAIDSDLLAARDAIESYKTAELRDYFKDDCVDAVRSRLTTFDRLSPDTAVIYPIMFTSRLELLMSLPTGLKRITVPVTADQLTQEIRAFRRVVEKRTTHEYLPHAQQLYDWLIRPLEADLSPLPVTTLVFVPDSALRTIPMAALHDGSTFLINKFALAMTPGITLTDPRPLNRDKLRFLTAGLTKSVQGFPPLPHVVEEVQSLQQLYTGEQLMNQAFQASRLEHELRDGQYGGLHIATHGQFSTDVNDSFLLTFDGKLTMQSLDHLIGLFRFRQEPLELLTLSACQTGIGDDRAALGLAGVALKAGARSALATLWFINDEASATLIAEFYRQLRHPAVSKAVALQRAQVKLLSDRIYGHPAYWSPFLLMNNWL